MLILNNYYASELRLTVINVLILKIFNRTRNPLLIIPIVIFLLVKYSCYIEIQIFRISKGSKNWYQKS